MDYSINKRYVWLWLSAIINIFAVYILPVRHISDWEKSFGYPFGWFNVFHDTIGDTIAVSLSSDTAQM